MSIVPACHIVHFVFRFSIGGLENVVVQLINSLPKNSFRHTVIAITEIDSVFAKRIEQQDVEFISLGKGDGHPYGLYARVYGLLRRLKPDVFHSCNLAALEFAPIARLAGVPRRVHAEHGWDIDELGNKANRYKILRRLLRHFVHEFIAVSVPLHHYLENSVGVDPAHLHLVPNGVDSTVFHPRQNGDKRPSGFPFHPDEHWVVGMVGRLVPIKNPLLLVDSFISLVESRSVGTERMRLAIVGDGPLFEPIRARMASAGLVNHIWLPGVRADVADILRAMNCFVLPSLSEATSCTLQEAMATGLAIVATDVGGNPDLLEGGLCGVLVPSKDLLAMATAIDQCLKLGPKNPRMTAALNSVHQRYELALVMQLYQKIFLSPSERAN